jgi:hypothetical protein
LVFIDVVYSNKNVVVYAVNADYKKRFARL